MKIIYKSIIRISLVVLAFLSVSCEDFLEKEPLGDLTSAAFFETQEDAIAATNAVYNSFRRWFINGGFPMHDIMSDDAGKGSNPTDASFLLELDRFQFLPSFGLINNMWSELYVGVKRSNIVINRLPDITMDEGLKTRLIAEARFSRAYFYFVLVRAWGGVPIILSEEPQRGNITRASADEVYNQVIIPDLEFAIANLPEKSQYAPEDLGRATKGAAKGMLAKVSLYRNDFANAERLALEVINSGEYSLDPDFANVFKTSNINGSGVLFEVMAISDNFSNGGIQYGQTQGVRGQVLVNGQPANKGWGFSRPTFDLIKFYQDRNDTVRMNGTIIFAGETLEGEVIIGDGSTPDTIFDDSNNIVEIETYNQKVFVPGDISFVQFGTNKKILRYADVLLIAAEALNENGNSAQALEFLNMVRNRAGLPDATTSEQTALRELIWEERRAELAMEEDRFFDLVRQGRAAEVLGPLGFQAGVHEVFPIPQAEIDLTEGSLEQNPGY